MNYTKKRGVYESLPLWLKRGVGLVPFAWLAGASYRRTYAAGSRFDRASKLQLATYREAALKRMLTFATHEVPAYQHLRHHVERYAAMDALKEFPLVSKDTIQSDLERYLPRNFDTLPHYVATTGGTSGKQLRVFLDSKSQSIETAFVHRFMGRMGYTPRCRKATFRGVSFVNLAPNVYWQLNPIYNELQFSPFHMSQGNLERYVAQLVKYQPQFLHGYPSAISALADFILRNDAGLTLPPIKAAFLASEGCTPLQRERIERAFNTRVFSWYGHTERVIFGGECEADTAYHQFPDYGILEIIDGQDHSCEQEGERGELVGTGLNNWCMPLIRYRTGDYATRLSSECGCGRHWDRFGMVEGRWAQDMVIGKDGAKISVAALNMHGELFDHVVRYQYYQDRVGFCDIRVVPASEFTDGDARRVAAALSSKTRGAVTFGVHVVDDIPLTGRGKLKVLVSKLDKG